MGWNLELRFWGSSPQLGTSLARTATHGWGRYGSKLQTLLQRSSPVPRAERSPCLRLEVVAVDPSTGELAGPPHCLPSLARCLFPAGM